MKKLVIIFILFSLINNCSQNVVKEDIEENKSTIASEITKDDLIKSDNKTNNKRTSGYISNEDINKIYKSLLFRVTNKKNNVSSDIEIMIGDKKDLDNTSLSIEVLSYFPDFVIDENEGVISKSLDDRNPAAKVRIYKNNKLVFNGWLFRNFPEIHAFDDPEYGVKLISSIRR